MEKLQVSFKFLENVITHYNLDNKPVYGDIIRIEVNGQIFEEIFKVEPLKTGKVIERERARLFGESLKEIGNNIVLQALYGEPSETTISDRKAICF